MTDKKTFIENDIDLQKIPSVYTAFITTIAGTPVRLFTSFLLFVLIAYLPLLFLTDLPQRDVASRYALMVEAFARGDFDFAFHPRCQMLHTTVAGLIARLGGCSGFWACKIASFLFFAASAFPLFFMCRRVFGGYIARGAVLLLALTPPLVEYLAVSGLRDSAKMFTQMLMAHAVVCIIQQRSSLKNYIYAGISCGLAICVRNDMVMTACIVLFLSGLLDRAEHRWIYRSLVGLSAAVAVSFLEMSCNSFICGYFIPGARYYDLFLKAFGVIPTFRSVLAYAVIPAYLLFAASVYISAKIWSIRIGKKLCIAALTAAAILLIWRMVDLGIKEPERVSDFLNSILKGIYPVYSSFALIGIFFKVRNHQWKTEDTFLAILFGVYDLSVISQIILHDKYLYVSSRYLIPALPLLFAWCWCGVAIVWRFLSDYIGLLRRTWMHAVVVFAALTALLYCSYRSEINNRTRSKSVCMKEAINQLTSLIKAEPKSFAATEFSMMRYNSNARPRIYFDCSSRFSISAYCGGGSPTNIPMQMDMLVSSSENTEQQLKKRFPSIDKLQKVGTEINARKQKIQLWRVTQK